MNEHVSSAMSCATSWRGAPLAFLFPGQGSQEPGMGKALAAAFPAAREVFAEADAALGESLSQLCFEGPAEVLAQTANTQPAILSCSVAALRVLREETGLAPAVCLGHSLGEFSALVAAGALAFADALRLVRLRGQAMQEAVPAGVGAMAAILGAEAGVIEGWCEAASRASGGGEVVSPANENGGGQVVIAGHVAAVDRVIAEAKAQRAKGIRLNVSAPFHCALMQPAAERMAAALQMVTLQEPSVPVIGNVDAEAATDPQVLRDKLIRQITGRVRWEASMRSVVRMGITRGLEVGHGKVLSGLIKRIERSFVVVGFGSPTDLDVLKESP